MTRAEAVASYISVKLSSGAVYEKVAPILRSFAHFAGDIPVGEVSSGAVRSFWRGSGPPTRWQENKRSALQGLFQHLLARGHLSASPLSAAAPRLRPDFQPRIYSREELRRLLDATEILQHDRLPLRPQAFRTLLLLLYCTGLRPGEARRLRLCDIDLDELVVSVWDSKFFKSRLVPFGTSLSTVLRTYREARLHLPLPSDDRSAFLASARGGALSGPTLSRTFARLRERAGIRNPPQARWQPRLHDLRHTFAVRRLLAWYREGTDVQARLPWLATYLGHANLSGTQHYLTMTPELLAEASLRFQRYAEPGPQGAPPWHPPTGSDRSSAASCSRSST